MNGGKDLEKKNDAFEQNVPTQKVQETKDGLYIDGFNVEFVIEDSISIEKLSQNQVIVGLKFIAAAFEKETIKK